MAVAVAVIAAASISYVYPTLQAKTAPKAGSITTIDRFITTLAQQQLFSGTVQDNLTLGDPTITTEQARRAATLAGADRFIRALPDGYDTILSDSGRGTGVQLSAGQRQLLALARALVTAPAALLLDEATAVIDGASDAAFRAALHEHVLGAGTAVLTVAHRLATAREADCVLVMAGGRIVEQGAPGELLTSGGRFATLIGQPLDVVRAELDLRTIL